MPFFVIIRSYMLINESMFLGRSDPPTFIDRIIPGNCSYDFIAVHPLSFILSPAPFILLGTN